ncbi:nucleotidyltransferase domain-containing protein [Priestia aryabhattai]|uniref:DNA polymerase beta superfamily protein n=1 Tax=Priestia aryabhattai TaxID=412384 RepID=UPI0039A0350D
MLLEGREIVFRGNTGSWNYNLGREKDLLDLDGNVILKASDKDYKAFALPTFEELYSGQRFKKSVITATQDNDIHDVRKMADLFFKSNLAYLEVLYSKDVYVNSYHPEMKEIYDLRHDIFKMNLPQMYKSLKGTYFEKMKNLDKGTEGTKYLVEQFTYDTKQAQHAYRYLDFGIKYAEKDFESVEYALRYWGDAKEFIVSILEGFFYKENFERLTKFIYESRFLHLEEYYMAQPVNIELKEHLENLIMKMVKRSITAKF